MKKLLIFIFIIGIPILFIGDYDNDVYASSIGLPNNVFWFDTKVETYTIYPGTEDEWTYKYYKFGTQNSNEYLELLQLIDMRTGGFTDDIYYLIPEQVNLTYNHGEMYITIDSGSFLKFGLSEGSIYDSNLNHISDFSYANIFIDDMLIRPDLPEFDLGYNSGKSIGFREGYQEGFDKAFDDGFGEGYDEGVRDLNTAIADAYARGKRDGLASSNEEIFNEGYNKGSQDSFIAGIEKWIVPAIITVILGGGVISFIMIRGRRE